MEKSQIGEFYDLNSIKELKCYVIDSIPYVSVEDLLEFIKLNFQTWDKRELPRKFNIHREVSKFDGIIERNGTTFLNFRSLMRYMFRHEDDFNICYLFVSDVEQQFSKHSKSIESVKDLSDDSTLKLYQDIAENDFSCPTDAHVSLFDIKISESTLTTIHSTYKDIFSEAEWQKICKFEFNFQHSQPRKLNEQTTVHNSVQLTKKRQYYEACKSARDLGSYLGEINKATSIVTRERKDTAAAIEGITLKTQVVHLPEKLESLVKSVSKDHGYIISEVSCVDCSESCKHPMGIHLFCEASSEISKEDLFGFSTIIRGNLKHHVYLPIIIYVKKGTISKQNIDGGFPRFELRDRYALGKLKQNIILIDSKEDDNDTTFEERNNTLGDKYCTVCFSDFTKWIEDPLSIKTYNNTREWSLHVPLPMKLFFEHWLINSVSLRKSENKEKFVLGKLGRLQSMYDVALNTQNKMHYGMTQEMNTAELIVNYHNASSVFSIAQESGITQSLLAADQKLNKLAEYERCYFETFIAHHPLTYQPLFSIKPQVCSVNLRQCHIILYMDNLVRFRKHSDPTPGSGSQTQLNTMPITLKGMPKDDIITTSWHLEDCPGGATCSCKDPLNLTKADIENTLFKLNAEEEEICSKFRERGVLDLRSIILSNEDLMNHFETAAKKEPVRCMNNLVDSFHDMSVDEKCINDDIHINETESTMNTNENSTGMVAEDSELLGIVGDLLAGETLLEQGPEYIESIFETSFDSITEEEAEQMLEECANIIIEYDQNSTKHDQFISGLNSDECVIDLQRESLEETMSISSFTTLSCDDSIGVAPLSDLSDISSNEDEDGSTSSNIPMQTDPVFKTCPVTVNPFKIFKPPNTLCRHPPPAVGRDDDKWKLKEVLDDILLKSGHLLTEEYAKDRILFAPDYKIAANLFQLMQDDPKYTRFLPEFPILHLVKSKITNLFSAYKAAGILHLMKYMKDDEEENEWAKLITIKHIEAAAKYVKRLSLALHLAFFMKFVEAMEPKDADCLLLDMRQTDEVIFEGKWIMEYNKFINTSSARNATFLLHLELMIHCDEIVGLTLAERMGGKLGHCLLLALVKSSLPFSFLNGSSSYAIFATQLLFEHYSAGFFHTNLKQTLFSTPHKESDCNFSLDTQREMDHKDALKAFRPSSSINTIIPRMSIIDHLLSIQTARNMIYKADENDEESEKLDVVKKSPEYLGKSLSNNDLIHASRVATLILRIGALSNETEETPKNVYEKHQILLSENFLDKNTVPLGNYLIHRFCCKKNLFMLKEGDIQNIDEINGPTTLKQRIKTSKSVTINRSRCKLAAEEKSDKAKREETRLKSLKKVKKLAEHTSSEMNTCQALVQPDCTKGTITKSVGVRSALITALQLSYARIRVNENEDLAVPLAVHDKCSNAEIKQKIEQDGLVILESKAIPNDIERSSKVILIEFAGIKFKTFAKSGQEYLCYIENGVIKKLLNIFPNTSHMIICEEKYSFTPDDFKELTRSKRIKANKTGIFHLKQNSEIVSMSSFSRQSVTNSSEGKVLISNFLAGNVKDLNINKDLILDIDSEYQISGCLCNQEHVNNKCQQFAVPLRTIFKCDQGFYSSHSLNIKQRKGEAELAQADWLIEIADELKPGESVVSYVTSGDIDSIPIHLIAVSLYWPRDENNNFKNEVYVITKKPGKEGKFDIFNITRIILTLEKAYKDPYISIKTSFILSMGGNDYIPKFHGITHTKLLEMIFSCDQFLDQLFIIQKQAVSLPLKSSVNEDIFIQMIQRLYCPTYLDASKLSFDEIRQLSIKPPNKQTRNPQLWMPPASALRKLLCLINSNIEYLLTVCFAQANLPNFLQNGGLKKVDGKVEYDFGPEVHYETIESLTSISDAELLKKIQEAKFTRSAKRPLTSTPRKTKSRTTKRRPHTSTPSKIRHLREQKNTD